MGKIKIGIIREGKTPPDARVPLSPQQCVEAMQLFDNVEIIVQPSAVRCFSDDEYRQEGISLSEDLSDCDALLGVKEVPVGQLLPHKTYLFFSHTIKKQPHNRPLLQAILQKNIRLIDYEVITDEAGNRLIAFGFFAGLVGAHNSLWAYGTRTGKFHLPRMKDCRDYAAVCASYKTLQLPPVRIVLTGGGRVALGAVKNLIDMGIRQVSPQAFLEKRFRTAVFTQLHAQDYARRRDGKPFDKKDFYENGFAYESQFLPYARRAHIFINGIFYDGKAPAFFTLDEMALSDFKIRVIGDVTCDIMPGASVPCTIRPSTIDDPVFGFDKRKHVECPPFSKQGVDVVAIDNLPSELPRDASVFFGKQLIDNVLPELLKGRQSGAVLRGMIAELGKLTPRFAYLEDYARGHG